MRRRKSKNDRVVNVLEDIQKSSQATAKNTECANEKLDDIQKATKSKVPIILTVIGLIASISGVSIAGILNAVSKEEKKCEIYLFSEYSKVNMNVGTDITATLNFDTDSVIITAYLASGDRDALEMEQKNATEWQKRVRFDEIGIHKIVATAIDPDGNLVEDIIEVEVVSEEIDFINQVLKNLQ